MANWKLIQTCNSAGAVNASEVYNLTYKALSSEWTIKLMYSVTYKALSSEYTIKSVVQDIYILHLHGYKLYPSR